MQAILYSQARNNLKAIIGKVCDDFDEYIISTKDNKTAVLISYEEYRAMKETMYLLSSKTNRDRLNEAVDQHVGCVTTHRKTKRKAISIRLLESDIDRLKSMALHEGLPYQTFISHMIHKITTGELKAV